MGTIKSFVFQTLAALTGNTDGVVAQKNYRTAVATIKGQIAALEAKQVADEGEVETAQEKLNEAKYPATLITDRGRYLENIRNREDVLERATEALENTKFSIKKNQDLLAEYDQEVEESEASKASS